ncbi:MAG: hypothetical protein EKK48_12065 [Candidatus Melainabacteria bacterium]|nr:MAG: hypothetical protein EKK48_12065 [Candidatus Melainabacteria bacterium]
MLDTKKLPVQMITDIAQALGYDEDEETPEEMANHVAGMTPVEAFEKWCQWHGILGSLPLQMIRVLRTLEAAEKIRPSIPSGEVVVDYQTGETRPKGGV